MFFIITSFLFYDKLLSSHFKEFNWRSFFIGRFFRLTPLYVTVIIIMLFIVAVLSNEILHDKPRYIFFSSMRWFLFTIPGNPRINLVNAVYIVAGVTWSLPYEVCFYLTLPLIGLFTGQRPRWFLLIAGAGIYIAWSTGLQMQYVLTFASGIVAAHLIRMPRFVRFARSPSASLIVLLCFGAVLFFLNVYQLPQDAYQPIPSLFLAAAFCLIAGGANLFGLLIAQTSRRLGELAYSIYLLHGILLFSMINFVIGKKIYRKHVKYRLLGMYCYTDTDFAGAVRIDFSLHRETGNQLGKKIAGALE